MLKSLHEVFTFFSTAQYITRIQNNGVRIWFGKTEPVFNHIFHDYQHPFSENHRKVLSIQIGITSENNERFDIDFQDRKKICCVKRSEIIKQEST